MTPISILLVEDNPGDQLLMRTALKRGRIANVLEVADSAEVGLSRLRCEGVFSDARPIDVALFDINLPGMSGIELLHRVKSDDTIMHTPVIMLTSSDAPRDIRASFEQHANCYLTKPVDAAELLELLRGLDLFWFSIVKLPEPA